MPMKHYLAGSSIRNSPNATYALDFNAIYDMAFSNAPNVFSDVQVETSYSAMSFQAISQVRVSAVFDPSTGQNLGDDFKKFSFDTDYSSPVIGQMFLWKGSYWLAINTDNYQSISKSLIVRRCNNLLRWKDQYDNLIEEPCILANVLKEAGDYTTSQMMITSGFITLYCQRNSRTNTILPNDRFLFGVPNNRSAYRVYGNGRKLYMNSITTDETSPCISEFYLGAHFINEQTDDIVNGIADAYRNEYALTILDGDILQAVSFSKTLTAEIKQNDVIVSGDVVWSTSNGSVVSVTSAGVITCLTIGTATITCTMEDNEDIHDSITIYVSNTVTDDYTVEISPEATIIYEGESQTYNCYLLNNGIPTADTFSFAASGVSPDYFRLYIVSGNSFRIENIEKYLEDDLTITCTSGSHVKTIDVSLRGDF